MNNLLKQTIEIIFSLLSNLLKGFFWGVKWLLNLNRRKLYTDRLMNSSEKRTFLKSSKDGICFGTEQMSLKDSFSNVAVFSKTGGGKTTKIVIPTILKTNTNAVIVDPSGEIYDLTASFKRKQRFEVRVLNLSSPQNGLSYNPCFYAKDIADLKEIATVLVESVFPKSKTGGSDPFWNNSAISLIFCLLKLLKTQDKKYQNLPNVLFLIENLLSSTDRDKVNSFVAHNADDNLYRQYKGIISASENLFLSVLQTCRVCLDVVSTNSDIARLLSKDTINFEDIKSDKKVIYYIQANESQIGGTFSAIFSLFFNQLCNFLLKSPIGSNPVLLVLDEAGNFTIPVLSSFLTVSRKRNIANLLLFQDYSQVQNRYSMTMAKTMLQGGVATTIYLGGQPLEIAQQLEREIGKNVVSIDQFNNKIKEEVRPILTASEIRTLPKDKGLVMHSNLSALLTNIIPFYKQKRLLKLTKQKIPAKKSTWTDTPIEYVLLTTTDNA